MTPARRPDAIKLLQSAPSDGKGGDLDDLRRIRLARLQLIQGKPADARKTLAVATQASYSGVAEELRGGHRRGRGQP
jgi:predicted negative regulator of RcsB-dependent stress response